MENPIKIITPNAEQLARGTAVNMAFRFGMPTGTPLKVSDVVGQQGNPNFNKEDYYGVVMSETLTLSYVDTTITPPKTLDFIFHECLISLNLPKNIVTTALQGKNGTIKEYINNDDYQITLEAAVDSYLGNETSDARFDYPKDKISELIKMLKTPDELIIVSDFLKLFEINSVVVKDFSLTQETHTNRQSISIQLLSDEPYEIKLKNDNDVKAG
ncbi:DUF6046 domain-containing protein [Empedobacter falsenii]